MTTKRYPQPAEVPVYSRAQVATLLGITPKRLTKLMAKVGWALPFTPRTDVITLDTLRALLGYGSTHYGDVVALRAFIEQEQQNEPGGTRSYQNPADVAGELPSRGGDR